MLSADIPRRENISMLLHLKSARYHLANPPTALKVSYHYVFSAMLKCACVKCLYLMTYRSSFGLFYQRSMTIMTTSFSSRRNVVMCQRCCRPQSLAVHEDSSAPCPPLLESNLGLHLSNFISPLTCAMSPKQPT